MSSETQSWGSRVGLILAMAGNAVGLGNFLRFPVQAVNNGGGAFIIPYLVCFLLMGIPLLWIEWSSGRYGGRSGNHSTPFILGSMGRRKFWRYFGVFGIYTNIAVAAYYCYIESWTLSYVFHSLGQSFDGLSQTQVAQFFDSYVNISESTFGIPYEAVFFYVICLALNTWILSRGLKAGVEKVAKIGMPMLIIFGVFLAIRALTLGASGSPEGCLDCDATLGLNFLWEPQYDSLTNFNVWLAAAGQIFFTLSVGMGTIHCYAAYVRSNDDIALNAMSAGWMNGFVEIVLGASVVIPIAVGYLGLDWVKENAGFSMAFQTMPFLFGKWGVALGTLAGVMWFGLLFFAGITSSLAMGTPWMGFMQDEFGFGIKKSAITFGLITLVMGLPTVFFYNQGVFDQYDYWGATVGIVIFALAESILFSWIFGIDKGWDEINAGSDITLPKIYKPIIKYVTPTILLVIFVMSLITPKNNDFAAALEHGWELDEESIIGRAMNMSRPYNRESFADHFETDIAGMAQVQNEGDHFAVQILDAETQEVLAMHVFTEEDQAPLVSNGESVVAGQAIASGSFINDIFYIHLARFMLIGLFLFICALVWRASMNRSQSEL
ncbi:MAG: sodium-dependent transporter [Schleiferiaceae bacterium]|nr:sodium-dependent transporter [Schleiferiaceae bacterium]